MGITMYQLIAKQKVRAGFAQISRGDFEPLLAQFAPDIHFRFVGDHALTLDTHNREQVRAWFQRVHRIFPGLKLEAKAIRVSGFPWNMVVMTHWQVSDTLADGTPYRNEGFQWLRIRMGKVVEDYLIEDTQKLVEILGKVQALGNVEAGAKGLAG